MSPTHKREWRKIALIVVVAILVLMVIAPGLQESPYNEF